MAKKATREKSTFGGGTISHMSPPVTDETPRAINIVLSFEDALKLHLAIGQGLGRLNSYNRSTTEGRRSALALCVYPEKARIRVLEGKLRR